MLLERETQRWKIWARWILVSSLAFILIALLAVVAFYKLVLYNAPMLDVENLPVDKKLLITVPRGSSLGDIAQILQESGVIENARTFTWAARYLRAERSLKAGQYLLPAYASNHQVLRILQSAVPQIVRVTIPEGRTIRQAITLIRNKMPIDSLKFVDATRDVVLIRELGIRDTSLFGYLMPNTYFLDPGTSEKDIVRLMVREFLDFYDEELQKRAAELSLSVNQVVTLASIIEAESAEDEERYFVSAVYHNRLSRGMMLQADPTIQFLLPDGPRRLYLKDLEIRSPYNTYRTKGLPPGPINNPGKASILAALYPAKVEYLYMVADGSGKHVFSTSLADHLKAKKKLDRLRVRAGQKNR